MQIDIDISGWGHGKASVFLWNLCNSISYMNLACSLLFLSSELVRRETMLYFCNSVPPCWRAEPYGGRETPSGARTIVRWDPEQKSLKWFKWYRGAVPAPIRLKRFIIEDIFFYQRFTLNRVRALDQHRHHAATDRIHLNESD